jgi:hypothetical protein
MVSIVKRLREREMNNKIERQRDVREAEEQTRG